MIVDICIAEDNRFRPADAASRGHESWARTVDTHECTLGVLCALCAFPERRGCQPFSAIGEAPPPTRESVVPRVARL